ncbi:MAG: hypothetical protein FWD19_01830 [Defluviitaleaceae bacterium]|nr:hypothetical protein [Defluviitaleaceae bacterium]
MKKFLLLLILLVVSLSLFSACKKDDSISSSGTNANGTVTDIASASGFFGKLEAMSAKMNSYQAEQNFAKEFAARVENSPLHALNLLEKSFVNGTTTVNASSPDFFGNFTVQSDVKNFDFAMSANVNADYNDIEFAAFLNRDRFAVGSGQFGDTYGINFKTLAPDLAGIVGGLGVEGLGDFLREAFVALENFNFDPYLDAAADYSLALENITNNVEITVNGENVSARRVSVNISDMNEVFKIYDAWFDLMEKDATIISILDNPFFAENVGLSRAEIMSEIRKLFNEAQEEAYGDAGIANFETAYYIGAGERLLRFVYDIDMEVLGDPAQFKMTFDTGNSATDEWRIDIDANLPDFGKVFAKIVWNVREENGNHIHQFDVTAGDGGWLNLTFAITMDRNPQTGDFIVSNGNSEVFRGNFTVNGDNFNLRFAVEDVSFEMSTTSGVNIRNVDFVNLLTSDDLQELISSMMMMGMLGANNFSYDYDDDFDWENFDWGDFDWGDFDWSDFDDWDEEDE